MATTKYTINLKEHLLGGASTCSKPVITWDDTVGDCSSIRCINKNGWEVKVTVKDGCDESCFWGTYVCDDTCKDCDQKPVRFRICVCSGPGDCEGCSDCIDNLCVTRCEPPEFCNDADVCVECDPDHPCDNGKICVGGECVCPPTKPYLDSNGDCAPCNETSCPPGEVCTSDGCQPPVCPEGVWHPTKQECVECINSGHCGPNAICTIDNECECRPGFVRDVDGNCVSGPECVVDEDCNSPCKYCDGGNCRDVECPDGKVCIEEEDGCVEECDCDDPGCSKPNAACVHYGANICYCRTCKGSCANGEACGDGCYCDENLTCQPMPCPDTPCENGSDCGDGCGCDPVSKRCRPCASADCGSECNQLLGCECVNGINCVDVKGCDGPCSGYGGCGDGCYCDGSRCRPCADLSCEECAQHPECRCTSGKCEGNPDFCKDKFTVTDFACGVEAELKLENGCLCPGITAYVTPWYLSKTTTGFGGLNPERYTLGLSFRLAKGSAQGWAQMQALHLLDETQYPDIADNDTPVSGSVTVTVKEWYQPQVWGNGGWVSSGAMASQEIQGVMIGNSLSLAGIARFESLLMTVQVYRIGAGKDVVPGVSQKKIVKYEIETSIGTLNFANNCIYQGQKLSTLILDSGKFKTVTNELDASTAIAFRDYVIHPGVPSGNYDLGGKFVKAKTLTSASKRKPLFVWYRSEDNTYTGSDIIRKLYIAEDSPKTHKDTLWGPQAFTQTKQNLAAPEGRVFGDMYYRVTNDCACNDTDTDMGLLRWCDPEGMALNQVVFSQCNKKVEINSDIARPCSTNWDLREFSLHPDDNNATFKNRHQARYVLVIETGAGIASETAYTWRETGVSASGLYSVQGNVSIKDFEQSFNSEITALRLELRYGNGETVCVWNKEVPAASNFTPIHTKICEPGSNQIRYRYNLAANHITDIAVVGGVVVNGAGYKDVVADQGQSVTAHFTFSTYCPTTVTLNETCCDSLSIGFNVAQLETSTELTATVTGGTLPYSVKYYRTMGMGAELVGESTNSGQNFKVILVDPVPGLYYAEIIDGSGTCTKTSSQLSIDPRNPGDYLLTITPTMTGCAYTGTVSVSIPNQPDIVGSKIYYKVNSGAEQYFTVTSGMAGNGFNLLPATGSTVELTMIEVPNLVGPPTTFTQTGSATVPSNLTGSVPAVTGFTVNGSQSMTNTCAGDPVLLEVTGTPNALVLFDNIAPIALNGAGQGLVTINPTANTTYTITGVTSPDGICTGTVGVGQARAVSVTPAPTITVTDETCDGSLTLKTITFSNVTSATDQFGAALVVVGNTVTVPVATVTVVNAEYVSGLCTVTVAVPVSSCAAPTITGTVSGPGTVCAGDSALVTVSGISGGTAPYSYNYYTSTNYNETYILNQASQSFLLPGSDTVWVRVKDAFGNISNIGSVAIAVAPVPAPVIEPVNWAGVVDDGNGNYDVSDGLASVTFKTATQYNTYAWSASGTSYSGPTSGSGATFTIDPADISSDIQLQVTVTTASGCVGTQTITVEVVSAPAVLDSDELLFTTAEYKLYKVQVTPSSVGTPVLLCGAGNPAASVAMTGTGQLITAAGNKIYTVDVSGGCGNAEIGTLGHSNSLGMLTATTVISMVAPDALTTYDLNTNIVAYPYTINDFPNSYYPTGDLVRVGSTLYGLAQQQPSGAHKLIEFSIDGGDNITGFAVTGDLPIAPGAGVHPYGLAYVGSTLYLIYADGKTYNVNTSNVPASTLIGTIVVPMSIPIWDVTNNY